MRVVIQRVSEASVSIEGNVCGSVKTGMIILLGIETGDTENDADKLANKISKLRIFSDENGLMNLSVGDVNGGYLVISQFTLHADTRKGNRPSYIKAARPEQAIPLYESFIVFLERYSGKKVERGEFGADMKIALVNDGPVTIIMDTKEY